MSASRAEASGQLLMIAWEDDRWTDAGERWLRTCQPGGVLLSPRVLRTAGQTAELLRRIARALDVPPFLALEEEGGTRDPLRALFPPLPSPRAVAQNGPAAAKRLGELAGEGLKLLGFNTNFAPVLDFGSPSSEALFATRTFSADPRTVAQCGGSFLLGLRQQRILGCAKYFPGQSGAELDPQPQSPIIGKTMAQLWREDLIPYRELLPQLPLLMVSRGAYKAYDFDLPRPATLSPNVVAGLLRTKLGYRGVAVADSLDAEPILRTLDLGEAAIRSVSAGCDLLLLGRGPESAEKALGALKAGLETGRLPARRFAEALENLRRAKKGMNLPSGRVSKRAFDRLTREFETFGKSYAALESKLA